MPTYEYKCESCGHQFEKFQSMSAAPIRRCPKCKKNQVRRLIGIGAGLIFKGSGFYITDYRDASYKEKAKADSGEPKKDAAAADKSEAKTAAKTETTPTAAESAPTAGKSQKKHSSKPATES